MFKILANAKHQLAHLLRDMGPCLSDSLCFRSCLDMWAARLHTYCTYGMALSASTWTFIVRSLTQARSTCLPYPEGAASTHTHSRTSTFKSFCGRELSHRQFTFLSLYTSAEHLAMSPPEIWPSLIGGIAKTGLVCQNNGRACQWAGMSGHYT